jgi:hypothetical protein
LHFELIKFVKNVQTVIHLKSLLTFQ